jgi:ribosome-associated heat shock protein Hsp15
MYRSRTLAAAAIKGGKVRLNDEPLKKPAHFVKPGEVYTLAIGRSKKIIEVAELLEKRQSFEIVRKYYKDLSPPEERPEILPSAFYSSTFRPKGTGRPTKKDRRDIEEMGQ